MKNRFLEYIIYSLILSVGYFFFSSIFFIGITFIFNLGTISLDEVNKLTIFFFKLYFYGYPLILIYIFINKERNRKLRKYKEHKIIQSKKFYDLRMKK